MSEAPAIARYLEAKHSGEGRKVMGETALEQGLDAQWDARIWTVSLLLSASLASFGSLER